MTNRHAQPGTRGEDKSLARQAAIDKALREGLHEPDLGPERPQRQRPVDADDRTALGIQHIVTRVTQDARIDLRQSNLREESIDQQLVGRLNLLVEQLGVVVGVAIGDRKRIDSARIVCRDAAAVEAEARPAALFDERRELRVASRSERAGLAEGEEAARRIRATADRERTVLLAEADRQSSVLRGEGDAARNRILGEAYGKDREFFDFYRTLDEIGRAHV